MRTILKRLPLMMLVGLLLLGGCKTRIRFQASPPLPTPYRVNDAVIISFPDELEKRTYRIKTGKLWERHDFIIPVGEAYASEASGRMKGLFTEGVILTNHTFIDQLLAEERMARQEEDVWSPWEEDREGEAPTQEERDLQTILDEMARQERGERVEGRRRGDDLAVEGIRESAREIFFEQRDPGYLLRFHDAQLAFVDYRCMVSFRVEVADWRTKNVLLDKRYRGRSRTLEPHRNSRTNEINIRNLVREAYSGTMLQLMEDIIQVTGAEGPSGK